MLILPIIALLCSPAIWMVLGRPKYAHSQETSNQSPRAISVIIPARDEEQNINNLLQSLEEQNHKALEIIVVNDSSTDRTAEVAMQLGATVIDAEPLPDGWNGKPWACHQGARHAQGDWYLFLDADTTLAPNALESLEQLTHTPHKVYSICPYHHVERPYEELSAFFNVLILAGSNAFGTADSDNPSLFGQCLLISRQHYSRSGGHETVKGKVLENFHLSARLNELSIKRQCFMGKDTVAMRMFPNGFPELWTSWQKGFSSGAAHTAPKALLWSSVWISGLMFTLVSLGLALTPYSTPTYLSFTAIAYFVGVMQASYAFRLAGNFSYLNALLFPVSLIFYQCLFFTSLIQKKRGKPTQWKGRNVN